MGEEQPDFYVMLGSAIVPPHRAQLAGCGYFARVASTRERIHIIEHNLDVPLLLFR